MVCWVEPSAQNSIYISNNTYHKKLAELNSNLLWPARNLHTLTRRLQGLSDPTVLRVTMGVFISHPSPPMVIFFPDSFTSNRSSPSLKLSSSQLPCSRSM